MTDLTFRFAERKDIPLILRFIKELADYEGLLSEVVATEEILVRRRNRLRAVFPQLLHISGESRHLSGRFICIPCPSGQGLRQSHFAETGADRCGKRLRQTGMVVSGYQHPFHRVLSLLRGGTYVRLDGIPSCRRYPEKNGRRLSTKKAENSHTGNFLLFFFYFKRISRTRKNANDPKVTSRNNGKNCGGRFPPKADWNTR